MGVGERQERERERERESVGVRGIAWVCVLKREREKKKVRVLWVYGLPGPSFKIQCNQSNGPHEAGTQNKRSLLRPSKKILEADFCF